MSLLTICQNVAADLGLPQPKTVYGNTDTTVSALYANSVRAAQSLHRRGHRWTALTTEHVFQTVAVGPFTGDTAVNVATITNLSSTTGVVAGMYVNGGNFPINTLVSSVDSSTRVTCNQNATATATGSSFTFGQSDYTLPTDYFAFVDDTLWDRTRFWKMRGAMSPQEWQLYKSSALGKASIERRWRVRLPTGSTAGASTKFSIDPVVQDNGSYLVFEYYSKYWCQSSDGLTQRTIWAADSDTGLLDEYLIELGTRWRTMNFPLGIAYAEQRDEYEREVDKAVARDGGSTILDLSPSPRLHIIGPYNIPETGFGA